VNRQIHERWTWERIGLGGGTMESRFEFTIGDWGAPVAAAAVAAAAAAAAAEEAWHCRTTPLASGSTHAANCVQNK